MEVFAPVNRCIYCYRTVNEVGPLTKEHVLAQSLGGDMVLPKASCEKCREITGKFEQTFARTMYGSLRWRRNFPSKRTKDQRAHIKRVMYVIPSGEQSVEIHPDDYPGLFLAPELPEPSILSGSEPVAAHPEIKFHLKAHQREVDALALEGTTGFRLSQVFDMWAFYRTLAKTAHAYTVAKLGLAGYEPFLPKLVLDNDLPPPPYWHYIGGVPLLEVPPIASLDLRMEHGFIIVRLRLLGTGRLPTYQAVAGRLKAGARLRVD